MREILFRGKRLDNGEWVEGYYGQFHNRPVLDRPNSHQIFEPMENARVFGSAIGGLWHIIIPETVGQYTGLTDKNGTKIFEGDIVKADGYIFVVKFGKCGGVSNVENYGYMGFYFDGFDKITKDCIGYGLRNDMCYFTEREVIGNLHDNPELMKEGVTYAR